MAWSTEWTKSLVLSDEFDVFPLQFSNINRIESNDAVYIFDEVGCGKTISAGLMALHYLENAPSDASKNVQIITINALVKPAYDNGRGQFLNDWYEKLPFISLNYTNKVSICNNHYKNIEKIKDKKIGLLIIDEAHLFLEDTYRLGNLMSLHAQKVVFLSATPIKHGRRDLIRYCDISDSVTGKKCSREWIKQLISGNSEKPICGIFEKNSPVSRYFKDTVVALEYTDESENIDFDKNTVKRLVPQIWEFEDQNNKAKELVNHLIVKSAFSSQIPKNRYVIFTRYIKREANVIVDEFEKKPDVFERWNGESINGKLTYVVINGSTNEKATMYSHNGVRSPLPDIIIITYQIAEQGVNLPGYNYVINYHIPAYPASLEQRFGRIDRMGKKNPSQYPEINMVFLLSKNGWETYKMNFYTAVSIYRYRLLTYVPAKNVLLTPGILGRLNAEKDEISKYIEEIREYIEDERSFTRTVKYFRREAQKKSELLDCTPDERKKYLSEDNPEIEDELTRFCIEHEIDLDLDEEDGILKDRIYQQLDYLKEIFKKDIRNKVKDKDWHKIINQIGDKIYYFGCDEDDEIDTDNLKTLDAVHDCAEYIYQSAEYKEYEKWFNEQVRIPKLFEKWSQNLEDYFETQFLSYEGDFENIFTYDYSKLFKEKVLKGEKWESIKESEKKLLIDNASYGISGLPFFKMVKIYQNVIKSYLKTNEGSYRERFDYNAIKCSYNYLKRHGYIPKGIDSRQSKPEEFVMCLDTRPSHDIDECSKWLKLFYHCVHGHVVDYIQVVDEYNALAKSCEMLIPNEVEQNSVDPNIIDIIKSKKESEIKHIVYLITIAKLHHQYNSIPLFYILFSRYDYDAGERKWRKPYRFYDGKKLRSFSDILFINKNGKRKHNIWRLSNPKQADIWTYLFYGEIQGHNKYRIDCQKWWLSCFLPDRCFSGRESDRYLLEIFKKRLDKILLNDTYYYR